MKAFGFMVGNTCRLITISDKGLVKLFSGKPPEPVQFGQSMENVSIASIKDLERVIISEENSALVGLFEEVLRHHVPK